MSDAETASVAGELAEWATLIGRRVRDERRRAGLTQDQLASKIGVAIRTLSSIENGDPNVRPANRQAVMDALGIDGSRIRIHPDADTPKQAADGAEYVRRWISAKPSDAERDDALYYLLGAIGRFDANSRAR